jgi:threonylcarbamoyladenosine tRNA methylthiotransferase MtaB
MPDAAITTDVIVGFPGETEEMYLNGYHFMERMQFAEMHVFPYSKRTGTPAARMEDQVDEAVKNRRVHELIQLSEKLQLTYAKPFVGDVLEVIPEKSSKEMHQQGVISGFSDNYLQVIFPGSEEMVGQIVRVKITEAGVKACKGEFVRILQPTAI